jgi:hypothetical protein
MEYIQFAYVHSLKKNINVYLFYKHSNVPTFCQYGHCLFLNVILNVHEKLL